MRFPKPSYKNRWFFYGLVYVYVIVLYLSTNHHLFLPPHFLRLTPIDKMMPFWPWTGWIYILVYFMPLAITWVIKEDRDVQLAVISFILMATACTMIFVFYPTTYPRPPMDAVVGRSLSLDLVRLLDTPNNCLPSQHVALAFLSAFFIQRYRRRWGNAAIVLAVAIAVSTLTTKQHYVWDVVTGYAFARLLFVFMMYKEKRPTLGVGR
jgi:membrane-associated phospholipid phosphatase